MRLIYSQSGKTSVNNRHLIKPNNVLGKLLGCVLLTASCNGFCNATELKDDTDSPFIDFDRILDSWHVKGFATLGYTQTDKYDDRVFRRNITQDGKKLHDNGFLVDSRVGVQVVGDLNDHWEFVFLGVIKHQYGDSVLDYVKSAFVRHHTNSNWQVALGRQPFDLFFLSDHRNVGYSYDWVRPPTEFYGIIPYDSFDGIKISKSWGDFDNDWTWSLSVGLLEEQFENDAYESDRPGRGDVTEARPIYNTEITWRNNNWFFRANYAHLEFNQDLDDRDDFDDFLDDIRDVWPDIISAEEEFMGDNKLGYFSFGAQWEDNSWKVQTEISKINAGFTYYDGWRGYLHIRKRLGQWMPYVTFGFARDDSEYELTRVRDLGLDPDDPLLDDLLWIEKAVQKTMRSVRQNQRSIALGLRWDFAAHAAAKFQCDYYKFDADSGSIHGRVRPGPERDDSRSWCSMTFDWVF